MTTEHEATRTLVKSPPELWAECSDAASLARHLGEFGEIKITRLEPETAVAWEGEHVSGTVRIEPSAWGTRVTLTAQMTEDGAAGPVVGEAVAVVVEHVVEPQAEVVAEQAGTVEERVAMEERAVVEEPVVEEPVVEEPVVEERVAAAEASAADAFVAPAPKPGVMARIRAYFRRAGPTWVEGIPASRDSVASRAPQASPEPRPVTAEPAAAERDTAEGDTATEAVMAPEPEPEQKSDTVSAATEPEPEPPLQEPEPALQIPESTQPPHQLDPGAVLTAALDSLGQAHHRPFSRA